MYRGKTLLHDQFYIGFELPKLVALVFIFNSKVQIRTESDLFICQSNDSGYPPNMSTIYFIIIRLRMFMHL